MSDLRISIVSVFGNEQAIAPAFLSQVSEFSDFSFFASHNCSDDTIRMVRESGHPVEEVYSAGHPQGELMSNLVNEAFRAGADFVIPLDFDEFLAFESKVQLQEFLSSLPDYSHFSWRWKSIFSRDLDLPLFERKFVFAHAESPVSKVFLAKSSFSDGGLIKISQGSHELLSDETPPLHVGIPLYHIPIHGRWHFAQKSIRGAVVAIQQQARDRDSAGNHWVGFAHDPFPSDSRLSDIALDYGMTVCSSHHIENEHFTFPYLFGAPYLGEADSAFRSIRAIWTDFLSLLAPVNSGSRLEIEYIKSEFNEIRAQLLKKLVPVSIIKLAAKLIRAYYRLR